MPRVWLDGIDADSSSVSFLKRAREVIKETRPACLVCPQNQGTFYGLAQRVPLVDYSSQEALFTDAAHYGYHYFPNSGGVEVLVPRVGVHEVVCFELS